MRIAIQVYVHSWREELDKERSELVLARRGRCTPTVRRALFSSETRVIRE